MRVPPGITFIGDYEPVDLDGDLRGHETGAVLGGRAEGCGCCEAVHGQSGAGRMRYVVQLTTDGHRPYLEAVEGAIAGDVDYAQLITLYGPEPEAQKRYSPPVCNGAKKTRVQSRPDPKHISTSYVERQNLIMRMSMRRFTRLTNEFSKKLENHVHAISLHYMYYNLGRIHQSLKVTPAMKEGVTDHVWTLEEIAALAPSEAPKKRGPYKKHQISD